MKAKIIEGRDAIMDIPDPILRKILTDASSTGRKQTMWIIGLMLALAGGGGSWMSATEGTLQAAEERAAQRAVAEAARESRLAAQERGLIATSQRVEAIAVLLVQQGRYVEDMVRAVAPTKTKLPPRPPALDDIEREILSGRERR